jgi:hypothetical protein
VQEADEIVGVVVDVQGRRRQDFTGENRGADAVRPEIFPGQGSGRILLELVQFFDDGRGHRQLANLSQPEEKHGFFDVVHARREAEIDGIDHAQKPRAERRVAPDDLGDLRIEALFGLHERAKRMVDALERGELRTRVDAALDFAFGKRRGWRKRCLDGIR